MKPTDALQKTLYDELVGHVKETDLSVPYRNGPYLYYSKSPRANSIPYM